MLLEQMFKKIDRQLFLSDSCFKRQLFQTTDGQADGMTRSSCLRK